VRGAVLLASEAAGTPPGGLRDGDSLIVCEVRDGVAGYWSPAPPTSRSARPTS
jgi:hypothetical protein